MTILSRSILKTMHQSLMRSLRCPFREDLKGKPKISGLVAIFCSVIFLIRFLILESSRGISFLQPVGGKEFGNS